MMKRALAVLYTLGILAHAYDLFRGQHDHGRGYDIIMHICWIVLIASSVLNLNQQASR